MKRKLLKELKGYGKRQYKAGFNDARAVSISESKQIKTSTIEKMKKSMIYKNARNYPCKKCNKKTPHYPITGRKSFSCQFCGTQFHPAAGTIFEKSRTPDHKWDTVFSMLQEDKFVTAKDIQRSIKVTYKTAWRMRKLVQQELYPDFRSLGRGWFEPRPFRGNQYTSKRKA